MNQGKETPTVHVERAELLYKTDALTHAAVESGAQILEMAVHYHTGEPMPEDHRGLIRLAMAVVLYVQHEEPSLS